MSRYDQPFGFVLTTEGHYGQPPHVYIHGAMPFVSDDPCIFGCGCRTGWARSYGPPGVDPLGGCPANPIASQYPSPAKDRR